MSSDVPSLLTAMGYEEHCPICDRVLRKPQKRKLLYGFRVCRKCRDGFANRRQAAYIVDIVLYYLLFYLVALLPSLIYSFAPMPPTPQSAGPRSTSGMTQLTSAFVSLAVLFVFICKDGLNGRSPGKALFGVRVVDVHTREPIGFGRSFKRNLILVIPYLGPILVVLTMMKGNRLGDGWANTAVIWDKYRYKPPFDPRGIVCTICGYNLTGNVSGRCPECGTLIPKREDASKAADGTSSSPAPPSSLSPPESTSYTTPAP